LFGFISYFTTFLYPITNKEVVVRRSIEVSQKDRAHLETLADDLEGIARTQIAWNKNPVSKKLMSVAWDIKQIARVLE
jgi:hypothetical protein